MMRMRLLPATRRTAGHDSANDNVLPAEMGTTRLRRATVKTASRTRTGDRDRVAIKARIRAISVGRGATPAVSRSLAGNLGSTRTAGRAPARVVKEDRRNPSKAAAVV